ncbi:uncharacterized protein BP5553_08872 [Venustampulla echinocandica]|uniref:Nephrocystin 3-like N-terminal domain-containing protein n=1 Tax=Venustampulla echinocandica TaxID=2656787 RepID=A0A370TD83_9HELO|nr:uncharacterized protein BP5553_08872 [Venustampulla echinocandica]RDL32416.1 hypothetical protein BP5553_08872 [Venustampulla echinocandica]
MDGLSAASSVIAVVQIAQSIGSALKDYYEGVRDARDDIKKLYNAVTSLQAILFSLHHILNRESGQPFLDETLLINPSGPLRQAKLELHKLQLKPKKKDIEKVAGTIERYKSSLTLELQVEHLHLAAEHFDISEDIRIEIRAARFDKTRHRVISWLSRGVPDPSKEHNLARARHEKTTGSWLIESPSFETWLKTENSLLWLNAGAGKSILSSTVVDHVQKGCKDVEKQKMSHCLCSLIADICSNRRDTPTDLQEAYDQANYGQQKPTQESLITMLKAVLVGFEHVYMVIDGLDECPKGEGQRDELLALIYEIYGLELSCLHILLASRREIDIEDSFSNFPARLSCVTEVSVRGAHVEQDIQKYLKHRLTHRTFEKWKPALKKNVEMKLSTQVDGMFRLAALQLDALSQLRTESKIMTAIRELPKTLDAFYDRILSNIEHEDDQKHARRALQWLAFAARPISLKELAEAVIVQVDEEPYLSEEDQFMDSKDILEILPAGLVTTISSGAGLRDYIHGSRGGFQSEAFYAQSKPDADSEIGCADSDVVDGTETTEREQNSSDTDEEGDDVKQEDDVENSSHIDKKPKEELGTGKIKERELIVQFAHFSVKEYLVTARVASSPQ